jgi:glycyl-tRNA synthetase beta chain
LTFKRVTNILKKQDKQVHVDPGLFSEPCEVALWDTYKDLKDVVPASMARFDYSEALDLLARLRKPVDDLFDGVEILTKENLALRENRVGLLQSLARLFLSVADFSKFSI